jgi:hypothetical protein
MCCGIKTIYSDSGSDFGKVLVPPVLVPDPNPIPFQPIFSSFKIKKYRTKSLINVRSSIVAQKVVISFFDILIFFLAIPSKSGYGTGSGKIKPGIHSSFSSAKGNRADDSRSLIFKLAETHNEPWL